MRTIVAFALGFMVGRQLYFQLDKSQAQKMEKDFAVAVKDQLEELGLTADESREEVQRIQKRVASQ